MAQGKYLIRGEGNPLPAGAALTELFNRLLAIHAFLGCGGNQVGNRLAVPGYGDGLPALDYTKKFRQTSLGLGNSNLAHANPSRFSYQLTIAAISKVGKDGGAGIRDGAGADVGWRGQIRLLGLLFGAEGTCPV